MSTVRVVFFESDRVPLLNRKYTRFFTELRTRFFDTISYTVRNFLRRFLEFFANCTWRHCCCSCFSHTDFHLECFVRGTKGSSTTVIALMSFRLTLCWRDCKCSRFRSHDVTILFSFELIFFFNLFGEQQKKK